MNSEPKPPGASAACTTLVLDYPVSTNVMWRFFRGKPVLSAKGRAYKAHAAAVAHAAGATMLLGPVRLRVTLHARKPQRASGKAIRRIDLSNSLKVAEDALSGILYEDDKQTVAIEMNVGEPVPGGALVVTVSAYIS